MFQRPIRKTNTLITCFSFDDISLHFLTLPEFKQLLDSLNDFEIACTLFVVPSGLENHRSKDEFKDCLRGALDLGHELAQHGCIHSGNTYVSEFGCLFPLPFPGYKKQKERIELGMKKFVRLTGVKPRGFRSPFYLHNAMTLKVLSELNFSYDSSKTIFKPAYCSRVRVKMMRSVIPSKIEDILEIPVTGDYTYNLKNFNFYDSLKQALRDFDWIKSRNGVFVLNNHPNHVDLKVLFAFLRVLISRISHKTDFMRLKDLV